MKKMWQGAIAGAAFAAMMMTVSLSAQGPVKVEMKDGAGQSIGTATLSESMGMVHIQLDLKGLKAGDHALHVHGTAKCEGPGFTTAGGHFNPAGAGHGRHGHGTHHAGDLPSLVADAQGVARLQFESSTISVEGSANSVVGRGLIVHRDPDDYTTQPTGNAGPRLACAVIRKG